jgi:peroxiredoxin
MRAAERARAAATSGNPERPLARIRGRPLPTLALESTGGEYIDLVEVRRALLYFYPGNLCSPEAGYDSPVLDEAQHLSFARHWSDFLALNCMVLGVSSQSHDEQSIVVAALGVGHPLLCDGELRLGRELGLPTFAVDNTDWYCRFMLAVNDGRIVKAFYPVSGVTRSPAKAVAWMGQHGWS